MRAVKLSNGGVALVDDEDLDAIRPLKWYAQRLKSKNLEYAIRSVRRKHGCMSTEKMHRIILARKLGRPLLVTEFTDHIDGNGLHNYRANLRIATPSQNARNRHNRKSGCSSRFLGVALCAKTGKWSAQIQVLGEKVFLGFFKNELGAAIARERYVDAHPEVQARKNFAATSSADVKR